MDYVTDYENSDQEICSDLEKVEIELLLVGIYRYYGFDYRNYNLASIRRRIWHRIKLEKLTTVTELLDKVLHDKTLMEKLLADFSINVTEMFRDPSFFKAFRSDVVPLLKELPTIRIWHAGCSSGEEAYSMAILLKEEGLLDRTRIYATDMNDRILLQAKSGRIPIHRMKVYTSNYMEAGGKKEFSEYYTADSQEVYFNKELTDMITFAQHNLVTDSSFNEFHVIICRNVMIYFDRGLQERVHQLIYGSLASSGFLGLGNRESLSYTQFDELYIEINKSEKLYRKK
ncbi:CheR family methyltransferase [Litchfieldia salsa]|uniref:Chemotaxis protein methyltransferase CheR n=1 Tax=Litchfieldia salsa TaxID=930152 RepID=A0A1H0WCE8_9BACI|nr:protein-glutamate O-methyltransferase CheR [Litchfieldia salsa]SDP88430.1 chemotaxis protein methyltransferase CheR [Litchfieldia salsa]